MRFQSTMKVNHVDIFVSHSWSANAWLKYLAVCGFLNLSLAKKATGAAVVVSCLLVLLLPNLPMWLLFCMMVDIPVLIFFVFFFYGQHLTCGLWCPSMWVDKLCVDQGDESRKAAGGGFWETTIDHLFPFHFQFPFDSPLLGVISLNPKPQVSLVCLPLFNVLAACWSCGTRLTSKGRL